MITTRRQRREGRFSDTTNGNSGRLVVGLDGKATFTITNAAAVFFETK